MAKKGRVSIHLPKKVLVHTQKVEDVPFAIARTMRVRVSQSAIDRAVPNCPSKCAIGNQLRDDGYKNVRMGLTGDGFLSFTIPDGTERWRFTNLPVKAIKATYDVDAGKHIGPFEFRTGYGHRHRVIPWTRERYAGGKRRGAGKYSRADKGSGRTVRREALKKLLED